MTKTLNQSRPEVREGQVWRDNDPRAPRVRTVEVLRIVRDAVPTPGKRRADYARVLVRINGARQNDQWIRLDRFNPNRQTGYTLVTEAQS